MAKPGAEGTHCRNGDRDYDQGRKGSREANRESMLVRAILLYFIALRLIRFIIIPCEPDLCYPPAFWSMGVSISLLPIYKRRRIERVRRRMERVKELKGWDWSLFRAGTRGNLRKSLQRFAGISGDQICSH